MTNSLSAMYQFTHKSGRHIIAQTDSEFFHMQGNNPDWGKKLAPYFRTGDKGQFEKDYWKSQQVRHGFRAWNSKSAGSEQYKFEEKLNKFWNGARGYEKLFNSAKDPRSSRLLTGYFGCPWKRFVAEVCNHAIMQGDRETYNKCREQLNWYNGNMLCLPAPKQNN